MSETHLRNTTRAMKAVNCLDGHVYHIMGRSKTFIPDGVDGDLPEGVVKITIPSDANTSGLPSMPTRVPNQTPTSTPSPVPPTASQSTSSPPGDPRGVTTSVSSS